MYHYIIITTTVLLCHISITSPSITLCHKCLYLIYPFNLNFKVTLLFNYYCVIIYYYYTIILLFHVTFPKIFVNYFNLFRDIFNFRCFNYSPSQISGHIKTIFPFIMIFCSHCSLQL